MQRKFLDVPPPKYPLVVPLVVASAVVVTMTILGGLMLAEIIARAFLPVIQMLQAIT